MEQAIRVTIIPFSPAITNHEHQHWAFGQLIRINVPVRWCVWTRPGCRLVSLCRYTAVAALWECSRSGCSGLPFPLRRPAARVGEETRRWAFTAARCSVYCCIGNTLEWFQTNSCRINHRKDFKEMQLPKKNVLIYILVYCKLYTAVRLPCCHFLRRPAADGQCSTWVRRPPVYDPAACALTAEGASWYLSEGSCGPGCPMTADLHSRLMHLRAEFSVFITGLTLYIHFTRMWSTSEMKCQKWTNYKSLQARVNIDTTFQMFGESKNYLFLKVYI